MTAEADLPADLDAVLAALLDRANVCRLVSVADLDDALPARALTRLEADALLAALADQGFHVVEPDAAWRLARA